MKKIITSALLFLSYFSVLAQVDYSDAWEDFFSYNNVIDFYQDNSQIVALTENALFIYNQSDKSYEKFSSIRGLSGNTTSAFYYNNTLQKVVIGYENGLIEIIDKNKKVYRKSEIINYNISGNKAVQAIVPLSNNELLLAMSFGIVGFNLETLEFKSTYFIGNNSSEVVVNDILVYNNKIYAATANGLYVANTNDPYLIDYNNWTHYAIGNINNIVQINGNIVLGIQNTLHKLNSNYTTTIFGNFADNILEISANESNLCVTNSNSFTIYNQNLLYVVQTEIYNTENPFSLNTSYIYNNKVYLATDSRGIIITNFNNTVNQEELHPDGPSSNNIFSITAGAEHLWVVYGGYNNSFVPNNIHKGVSHFNGNNWKNLSNQQLGVNYNDLVHVSIHPDNPEKAYVSSWGKGMLVIENDALSIAWNASNSGLEEAAFGADVNKIRLGGSVFDKNKNLWMGWLYNKIFKYSASGQWTTHDLSNVTTDYGFGINEIIIDQTGNKWLATANNGAVVYNENGNKMLSINSGIDTGNLPEKYVTALAADKNNRIWIGTRMGLRYIDSSADIFSVNLANNPTKTIVVTYEEGGNIGEALLGNQQINTICVDGADNKWFGTENSGVLCTNYSGLSTIFQFDKNNSPLPSNKIVNIQFEPLNGRIFFATDKGIVAYKSNISPYGEHLQEVYAYPNPVKNFHDTVTIAGRNGSNIPYGTNVKILDAAGKLVYETNVKEGQEDFGGKVVWNKTNLAGNKVASGVYIVLLYYKDKKETATAKIAIIN